MSLLDEIIENTLTLPSGSVPYGLMEPGLLNGNQVKVRPFVVGDQRELVRASKSGDSYKVYKELLNRLVVAPKPFDFDSLLMSDVITILHAVRAISFGTRIDVEFECDHCNKLNVTVFDIGTLNNKLSSELSSYNPNNLQFEANGKKFVLHVARLKDEEKAHSLIQEMKFKNQLVDETMDRAYMRRAVLIDSVDGMNISPLTAFDFMMGLSIPDYEKLKKLIDDQETGLETDKGKIKCQYCKEVNDLSVPISPDFFRSASNEPSPQEANY